jgi:hypothetical protein
MSILFARSCPELNKQFRYEFPCLPDGYFCSKPAQFFPRALYSVEAVDFVIRGDYDEHGEDNRE